VRRVLIDIAIIGAGPYGLSLAAYLRAARLEFRIFGKTMHSWKMNMPPGMLLKSHPWSSSLYDPTSSFTLKQFCAERGIPYHDSLISLPVENFIAYGEAFQARFVPDVEQKLLVGLEPNQPGLRAVFDDGEVVTAKRIIFAVGVHPFKHVPRILSHLPAEVLSHSGDYGSLDAFAGKEVSVIGSGASAIDLAALLHEKGASVSLIARAAELRFANPPRTQRSLLRRLASPLRRLVYPGSGIGSSWLLKVCADAPWFIHALPQDWRLHLVRTTLGPLGGTSMKDRVVGKFTLRLGRQLETAEIHAGKVHLQLAVSDGTKETLQTDHVIAATGYKIDLGRLVVLDPGILKQIRMVERTPILSMNYETSIAGLHFIGPASANSFGPVARFAFGALHPSRRLTHHLSRTLANSSIAVSKL
jgi:cation diffusion facilitator CzcD-associated flavoprotein CzcO